MYQSSELTAPCSARVTLLMPRGSSPPAGQSLVGLRLQSKHTTASPDGPCWQERGCASATHGHIRGAQPLRCQRCHHCHRCHQ